MTTRKPRPWLLSECHYGDIKDADIQVAVVPLGATEPHNLHLPYGTDVYEASVLSEMAVSYTHLTLPTILRV